MSTIKFSADLDTTKLDQGLVDSNRKVAEWTKGIEKSTSEVDKSMQRVGMAIGAYFSFRTLTDFARKIIEVRGEFQQLSIAFETMLGTKAAADKMMADAIVFAQKTPFTLTEVASNIKQLIAMGVETDKAMKTLKALGDVAAGVAVPLSRVAINYGQVATMGKLQGRELRDFAMAGIPLIDELAKNLGVAKNTVQDLVTAGKVGFADVERAFLSMSSAGGKFNNLMEKQMTSVTGQISNLKDKIDIMFNDMGTSTEGIINTGIEFATTLVTHWREIAEVVQAIIVIYGGYKAALVTVGLIEAQQAKIKARNLAVEEAMKLEVMRIDAMHAAQLELLGGKELLLQQARANALGKVIAAEKALQASRVTTGLANQWVLLGTAIAAVGYAIYRLATYQSELDKGIKNTKLEIAEETGKINDLFVRLKYAKEGTEEWKKARQAIIDQYGRYIPLQLQELNNLQNIKLAQDAVNKSMAESIAIRIKNETGEKIRKKYDEYLINTQDDLYKKVEKKLGSKQATDVKYRVQILVDRIKFSDDPKDKDKAFSELKDIQKELDRTMPAISAELKGISASADIEKLTTSLKGMNGEMTNIDVAFQKYIDDLKQMSAQEDNTPIPPPFTNMKIEREKLDAEIAKQKAELKRMETMPTQDQNLLKSIEEKKALIKELEDLKGVDTKKLKKEQDILNKQGREKLEFERELNRGRKQNEIDIQQSLLNSQKDGFEKQRQQARLDFQKKLLEYDQQKEELLRKYNETHGGIDKETGKATKKYVLELPKEDQDQIDRGILAAQKERDTKIEEIDRAHAEEIKSIYTEISKFQLNELEKEKAGINKKYDLLEKRAKKAFEGEIQGIKNKEGDPAVKEALVKEEEDKQTKLLSALSKARTEEIDLANKSTAIKVSDYYRKAFGDIALYGYAQIKKLADQTEDVLKSATQVEANGETFFLVNIPDITAQGEATTKTVKMTIEAFNQLQAKKVEMDKMSKEKNPFQNLAESYKELNKAMKEGKPEEQGTAFEKFQNAIAVTKDYVDSLAESLGTMFGEGFEKTIKTITGLSQGVVNIGAGIGRMMSGDIVGGLQSTVAGATQIFSILTKGEKAFREAQKQWLDALYTLQLKYNNALIDELQIHKDLSVFTTSYSQDINRNSQAILEAQKRYNEILQKPISPKELDARSLIGSKEMRKQFEEYYQKVKDGTVDLQTYLTNLQIKTGVVREKIFGITTGHHDVFGSLLKEYPALIDANGKLNLSLAETILSMKEGVPDATRKGLEGLVEYSRQIEESQKAIESAISSMAGSISSNLSNALVSAWNDGTDAFKAFETSVNEGIKNIISQMLYNEVFSQQFKMLQDDIAKSFGLNGDQSLMDDFKKFFDAGPALVEKWKESMAAAEKQAQDAGFNWDKINTPQKGLTGQIQRSITEETGTELAGLFRRSADDTRLLRDYNKQAVNHLLAIENNTYRTVIELQNAVVELKSISNNTRPAFTGKI